MFTSKIKPLGNRILSRLLPPDEKIGRFFMSAAHGKERIQFNPKPAIVVAVGEGMRDPKTDELFPITALKAGDEVLLPTYPGKAVWDDDAREWLMMTEFDAVLCIRVKE